MKNVQNLSCEIV